MKPSEGNTPIEPVGDSVEDLVQGFWDRATELGASDHTEHSHAALQLAALDLLHLTEETQRLTHAIYERDHELDNLRSRCGMLARQLLDAIGIKSRVQL